MLNLLDTSTFVTFNAQKLRNPKIILSDKTIPDQELIDEYCFMIPDKNNVIDNDTDFYPIEKTFLAERYGGFGLETNAGGARCGISNSLHIKGIGITPLIGQNKKLGHYNGCQVLYEAIREYIFSKIFNLILPYGAVKINAIIDTNTFSYGFYQDSEKEKRALIIRESFIRPAHFMRNIYCNQFINNISDTERTKANLKKLINIFKILFPYIEYDNDTNYIETCLKHFMYKTARQLAKAHSLKFMHGALILSNISLDGRFADFGTTSKIHDFTPHTMADVMPSFHNEEFYLINDMYNLVYYINKFLNLNVDYSSIIQYFQIELNYNYGIEFTTLTGIKRESLEKYDNSLIFDLWDCYKEIIKYKKSEQYVSVYTDNAPEYNTYNLSEILKSAIHCNSEYELQKELYEHMPYNTKLVNKLSKLLIIILKNTSIDRDIIKRSILLNENFDKLFVHPIMSDDIRYAIKNNDVTYYTNDIINKVKMLYV